MAGPLGFVAYGAFPSISVGHLAFSGAARDGVVLPDEGLEPVVLHDGAQFHMWYHGAHDDAEKTTTGGPGWGPTYNKWQENGGVIRYATSRDGVNWTLHGIVIDRPALGTGLGLLGVTYHAGAYHMLASVPEQHGWDYYRSTDGIAWTLIKQKVLGFGSPDASFQYLTPAGPGGTGSAWDSYRTGNVTFYHDGSQWIVYYEGLGSSPQVWRVGRATGPDLEHLTKYAGNPVITAGSKMVGGADVHVVDGKLYAFCHGGDLGANSPTSLNLYESTDGITWTSVSWVIRLYATDTTESQIADPSVVEVDGRTHLYWEQLHLQRNVPDLCHAEYPGTIAEFVQAIKASPMADGTAPATGTGRVTLATVAGADVRPVVIDDAPGTELASDPGTTAPAGGSYYIGGNLIKLGAAGVTHVTLDAEAVFATRRTLAGRADFPTKRTIRLTSPPAPKSLRVRERPPLRVTIDVETPAGRRYRWAPDEQRPENVPAGLRWSSTMPGGYETLDVTLPRRLGVDYRDLDRLSTLTVRDAGGGPVGEYRLERAPRQSGDRMAISPSAVGWQAHLDDDKSAREIYVDRDLSPWGPTPVQARLANASSLSFIDPQTIPDNTSGQPSVLTGIEGTWPASPLPVATAMYGVGLPIGSLYYAWKRNDNVNPGNATMHWDARLLTDDLSTSFDTSGDLRAAGPGADTVSATAQRMFALVQHYWNPTAGGDEQLRYDVFWTCLAVYGAHGLTKRGASTFTDAPGLYASDIVAHAVGRWAPLLVITDESVTPSSFIIPHLVFKDPTTATEIVRAATRYGLQDWAVWDNRTFWWHPRGEHARNWRARVGPAGLEETGPQLDRLWESVIVQYQDVDGSTRTVGPPGSGADTEDAALKDSDPGNPANERGIVRRALLTMGVSMPGPAIEVGSRFLQESKLLDTSGRARITGHVEDDHGVLSPYHAIRAGDTITFTDSSDPSPRRIVRCEHDADQRAASLDLDAPPEGLQALLERFGVGLVPLGF